jgi:DNA-damage-inducible protein J
MLKTMSITTRVSPEIKAQAEEITSKLGINVSEAISIFLAQLVIHKGLPFEVTTDPFYSPSHVAYLKSAAADLNAGKKVYHDIIEEEQA